MKSMLSLLNESQNLINSISTETNPIALSALHKLKELKTTGMSKEFELTADEIAWLSAKSLKGTSIIAFRGMSINKKDIDKKMIDLIESLEKWNDLPTELYKKWNKYASYSKNKSIAQKYAMNGDYGIVIRVELDRETAEKAIVCDCENIETGDPLIDNIIQPEKEVIVIEKHADPFISSIRKPLQ